MRNRIATTALLAALVALGVAYSTVRAQEPPRVDGPMTIITTGCLEREKVLDLAETAYGTREPEVWGITLQGHLMEVFVAEDGEFGAFLTRPDGRTCLMLAGGEWSRRIEKLDPPEVLEEKMPKTEPSEPAPRTPQQST